MLHWRRTSTFASLCSCIAARRLYTLPAHTPTSLERALTETALPDTQPASHPAPSRTAVPLTCGERQPPCEVTTGEATGVAFAHFFSDASTSIDIAPVRRPQLLGSLVCSLQAYPVSVVLVEDCSGTSAEDVTRHVQRRAVRSAELLQAAAVPSGSSVHAFLVHQICEKWPSAMRCLRELDLSLQVRLFPSRGLSTTRRDEEASDTSSTSSFSPQWQCAASLYDPWQAHPQLVPLTCCTDDTTEQRDGAPDVEEVGVSAVVARVMRRVEQQLERQRAKLLEEAIAEAQLFVSEAGRECSETGLVRSLLRTAQAGCCRISDGSLFAVAEDAYHRSTFTLHTLSWADASATHDTFGLHVCLQHVLQGVQLTSAPTAEQCTMLSEATVNRGVVPLAVPGSADDKPDCVFSNSLLSAESTTRQALAMAELTARVEDGTLSLCAGSWDAGPIRIALHVVEAAALLSCTIAWDWVGAERCGEEAITAAHSDREPRKLEEGLPLCVRWTSFAGRMALDAFCSTARPLPPLWPRLRWVGQSSEAARTVALRELLRCEYGLQTLPRTLVNAGNAPGTSKQHPVGASRVALEYDTEVAVEAGSSESIAWSCAGEVEKHQVCVEGTWYADVAAAALVHTPWATPLCGPAEPSRSNTRGSSGSSAGWMLVEVLSLTDSLKNAGFVSAAWDSEACTLTCFRSVAQSSNTGIFTHLHSIKGLSRLLSYCAKNSTYVTARIKQSWPVEQQFHALWRTMLSASANRTSHGSSMRNGGGQRASLSWKEYDAHNASASVLDLPFGVGQLTLKKTHATSRKGQLRQLLSIVQHFSRDPAQFTPLLARLPSRATNFFHMWRVTRDWVHPRTSLQVSLRPTWLRGVADGCASDAEPDSREAVERGKAGNDGPARKRGEFQLYVDVLSSTAAEPRFSSAAVSDNATEAALSPLQRTVVTLPIHGDGWITTAYAAIHQHLVHASDLKRESTPSVNASSASSLLMKRVGALLPHCPDFARLAVAVLCTLLSSPSHLETAIGNALWLPKELLSCIFGNSVSFVKTSRGTELRVLAVNEDFVCLTHVELTPEAAAGDEEAAGLWRVDLCHAFLRAAAPQAEQMVVLVQKHSADLRLLKKAGLRFRVSGAWERNVTSASTTSTAAAGAAGEEPLYVAEISKPASQSDTVGEGTPLPRSTPSTSGSASLLPPEGSGEELCLRETGDDVVSVLGRLFQRLPECLPTASTFRCLSSPPGAGVGADSCAVFSDERGVLASARARLVAHHGVARVSHRYDAAKSCLVVTGHQTEEGSASMVIAEEAMPWETVPQRLFAFYSRLLHQTVCVDDAEALIAKLGLLPLGQVAERICRALGCEPAALSHSSTLRAKQWSVALFLPLSLFQLPPPAKTPLSFDYSPFPSMPSEEDTKDSEAGPGFLVTSTATTKKTATRRLYTVLYLWTRCANCHFLKDPDYARIWVVRCNAVASGQYRLRTRATTVVAADNSSGNGASPSGSDSPDHVVASGSAGSRAEPEALPSRRSGGSVPRPSSLLSGTAPASPSAELPLCRRSSSGRPAATVSVVDCVHDSMKELLSDLVDTHDGQVVLKVSQTFGLELLFEVNGKATASTPDAKSVQLVRESWATETWAPVQILTAEVSALRMLRLRGPCKSADDVRRVRDDVSRLFCTHPLPGLNGGASMPRRDFCVSFLRRYFGWRVCENDDVADLPITDRHGSIVVIERFAAPRTRGQRRRGNGSSSLESNHDLLHASLRLGQIITQGNSSVRLAQVLEEAHGASEREAREALWDACARRIKTEFEVSRLMTTAEVDAGVQRFMERCVGVL